MIKSLLSCLQVLETLATNRLRFQICSHIYGRCMHRPFLFGDRAMLRVFYIYLRYCVFCLSNLFKLHKYIQFLSRDSSQGKPSIRKISAIVDARVKRELRGKTVCKREDLILQFLCNAFKEKKERRLKEELELPLLLLFMWYCEPIDVSYSGEE